MTSSEEKLSEYELLEQKGRYQELFNFSREREGAEAKFWEILSLFRLGDMDECFRLCEKYEYLFSDKKWKAMYLNQKGSLFYWKGDFNEASQLFEEAHEIGVEINDQKILTETFNNFGVLNYKKGELERALYFYTKSYETSSNLNYPLMTLMNQNNLGIIYYEMGKYDIATDYFELTYSQLPLASSNGRMKGLEF